MFKDNDWTEQIARDDRRDDQLSRAVRSVFRPQILWLPKVTKELVKRTTEQS